MQKELIATHEVANCEPDEIVAPQDSLWEKCVLLRSTKSSHDVLMICDRTTVKNVPRRFVRRLNESSATDVCQDKEPSKSKRKRKRDYGWSTHALQLLHEAKSARAQSILKGEKVSQQAAFCRKYLATRNVDKQCVTHTCARALTLTLIHDV